MEPGNHELLQRKTKKMARQIDIDKNKIVSYSREEVEKFISVVDKPSRKRKSSSQPSRTENMKRCTNDSNDIKTLKEQTKALQEMVAQLLHNHGAESVNSSDNEKLVVNSDEVQPSFYELYDKDSSSERSSSVFQVPDLNPDIPGYSANLFDFSPCVKEAEPKIMPAPDDLLDQGVLCQRFGKATWANRYVKIGFHTTILLNLT